jgi:hypothetical protein
MIVPVGPQGGKLYDKARKLVGRFNDANGARDLAEEHDKYLQDSY